VQAQQKAMMLSQTPFSPPRNTLTKVPDRHCLLIQLCANAPRSELINLRFSWNRRLPRWQRQSTKVSAIKGDELNRIRCHPMDSLAQWLDELGLSQYAAVFAANDIDWMALTELTDHDLEKLGLSLGHRKRLLKAIAAQRTDQPGSVSLKPRRAAGYSKTEPERRQLTVMFCSSSKSD
jgi:hypothetical protein